VRYFNRTPDVYVAFVGISIVLTYQWLAINLIVQFKQLFARWSVLRFAFATHLSADAEKSNERPQPSLKGKDDETKNVGSSPKMLLSLVLDHSFCLGGFSLAIAPANSRRRHEERGNADMLAFTD
jgi:hypothetical protein